MNAWRYLHPAILVASVIAVYGNSLQGSFHYDDFHSIVQNPHIRNLGNAGAFFVDPGLFSADPAKAMYRPLLLVTYALNYGLGGYEVVGYHLFNLAVHLLCTLLVWRLGLQSGCGAQAAWLASLVFAVHPLATEPVNYISSRSESLGALGYLGSFLAYLYWRTAPPWGRGAVLYAISLAAYLCGLLSKSIVFTLPVVLILYEFSNPDRQHRVTRRNLLFYHAGYWLVAAGYMLLTTDLIRKALGTPVRPLDTQIWTQLKGLGYYLKLILMPVGLNVEHQFREAATLWQAPVLLSAGVLLSVAVLSWSAMPRRLLFWLLWAAATLTPSSLVPLNVLVNEHRLYLPMAGLALMLGAWWETMGRKPVMRYAIALLLLLMASLSLQRNKVWQDELNLWQDAVEKSPRMPRAHVHLGNALRQEGQVLQARAAYEAALHLEPDHRAARTNLGNLYYDAAASQKDSSLIHGYYTRAVEHYEQVLGVDPTYKEALNNLGSVYMMLGRDQEAIQVYNRAVGAYPNFAEAYFNLGQLKARQGLFKQAAGFYLRALDLHVDAQTWSELGNAYAGQDKLAEAEQAYRQACGMDRGQARYFNNLGEVLLVRGEQALAAGEGERGKRMWNEARDCFQHAEALRPGFGRAALRLRQLEERLR